MGSEIVYCSVCGDRILERDFQKGKAVTVLKKNYCSVCMVEVVKAEEPKRKIRTTRIPKMEERPSRRPLYIGIAIAIVAFILVMIVLTRG